jgi:protein-tyrosine phosphatase
MQKVLFVCLGNICRSPVAEGIMLHLIAERKLHKHWHVDSAGTAGYHIDETPDHRTIKNAKKNRVDLSKLRARKFSVADFDNFDAIYVMDESNYENVISMSKDQAHHKKVDYLLNVSHPGKNLPVPDPYYGTEKNFEEVFQLVYKACQKLIDDSIE